jgi:hypothetical protein
MADRSTPLHEEFLSATHFLGSLRTVCHRLLRDGSAQFVLFDLLTQGALLDVVLHMCMCVCFLYRCVCMGVYVCKILCMCV